MDIVYFQINWLHNTFLSFINASKHTMIHLNPYSSDIAQKTAAQSEVGVSLSSRLNARY